MAAINRGRVILLVAISLLFLVSIVSLGPCTQSGSRILNVVETTPNSIAEAEAAVGFAILVPSFLPAGVGSIPEIRVASDESGGEVTLLYSDNSTACAGGDGVCVTISEFEIKEGESQYLAGDSRRVVRVEDIDVELAVSVPPIGRPRIVAGWIRDGVAFQASFEGMNSSEHGLPTREPEAEALTMIESMISSSR